ncbi:Sensor protein VraS [Caulifigura coniformis]|uniref:Sensor protein VraS n=2 Tax=Caulifigura coniformis TaxID=2527983 RepID=A0A517SCB3_9PLAN|nr:Sensor protein VraS [Caulifigura coniformis]
MAVAWLLIATQPALALDSQRTLTQALLRKWQIQQGLPQPTITVIIQGADGGLWLGTQAGLYQFDGIRFDPALVVEGESLADIWINDLCEDSQGRLWIATRGEGLLYLHDGEVVKHTSPVGFPMQNVNCLMLSRQGELWAGGDGGLAVYRNDTFRKYDHADGLHIPIVRDIAQAADDSIWIGGDGSGLMVWKDGTLSNHPDADRRTVNTLLAAADGSLWAGTNRGLLKIDGPGITSAITTGEGLPDDTVECLLRAQDGVLWAGTRNGLCRIIGQEVEAFGTREGLTQSAVLTICEDHEGSLWVGTKHGLNQLSDRRTLPLTSTEGLPTNDAGPIVQAPSGQIWVGTLGGGLARYDGRRCEVAANRRAGLPSSRLHALAAGKTNDLWIGTDKGVCLWRDGEVVKVLNIKDGLPGNDVACLTFDDASRLWIGTRRGLVRYDGNSIERPISDPVVASARISVLKNAGQQGLIASTSNGVFLIRDDKLTPLPGDEAWLREVHAIEIGPEGEFWLASRGRGLMLIKDGEVSLFTIADGLFDDEIVGIAIDDRDQLWMGCSRGIFSVPRTQVLSVARGERARPLDCFSLSPTEGLRTVECQRDVQPAVSRTTDGQIWFSTIHGVLVIDPEKLQRELPTPHVEANRLLVNGEPMRPNHPVVVPPGTLNVSIGYTAHTYSWPSRTSFRYQLEGFDKDWVYAGTRRDAFYTNLSPGTYRFRVSAANFGGSWSEAKLPVEITLRAAFWQTPWFPLLLGLLAMGTVWLILRLRVLRVRARMDAIISERVRIARELHDTLIQGFSGVTMQMQAVSSQVNDPNLRKSIHDVISDAGACLREARQSVAGLRNSQGTSMGLAAALEQAARQITETRDVRLHLDLPAASPSLPVEVEFNLLRIAQEAITNAARHSHARTIDVALTPKPGRLALRVRDDGVGFSTADRERSDHRHYGLIGMRERSRQISADLTIESRPGAGTTILVDLPLTGHETNGAPPHSSVYNPSGDT